MLTLLRPIIDAWIARRARPQPEALAAVAGLRPAVIITGGSSGIGLALAKRFAGAGHAVILVARGEAALTQAAAEIVASAEKCQGHPCLPAAAGRPWTRFLGIQNYRTNPNTRGPGASPWPSLPCPQIVPLALDITANDAFARIEASAAAHGLYLDILVNSAGIGLGGDFDSHEPADIDRLIALDITALTRLMRACLPAMRARGRGGILNVASLGGLVPGPYQAAYYAAKAYVISLTEAVAAEIAGEGVRLSVLAPGPVATRFHARMGAEHALYRYILPAATADSVAGSAHRGYQLGHRVIVPGLFGPAMALGVKLAPHRILVPLLGILLRPRPGLQHPRNCGGTGSERQKK